jgi:hypothetical protein
MGFLDDLENALDNFTDWLTDWEFEEPEEEYEEPEFIEVEDDFFAPVADFFENLDKGTDEIVTDFVGELLGKPADEEKEKWYAYYWTYDGGYWGTEWMDEESGVFYSTEPNKENEVFDRIYYEYEDRYYGGQGFEVEPSVNDSYEVDEDEVDRDNIL